jgi:hypothetical protein
MRLSIVRIRSVLEFNLGSKSKNHRAMHTSAHVRVVLNDRLQKKHR